MTPIKLDHKSRKILLSPTFYRSSQKEGTDEYYKLDEVSKKWKGYRIIESKPAPKKANLTAKISKEVLTEYAASHKDKLEDPRLLEILKESYEEDGFQAFKNKLIELLDCRDELEQIVKAKETKIDEAFKKAFQLEESTKSNAMNDITNSSQKATASEEKRQK